MDSDRLRDLQESSRRDRRRQSVRAAITVGVLIAIALLMVLSRDLWNPVQ